jgi:hypothetical protein
MPMRQVHEDKQERCEANTHKQADPDQTADMRPAWANRRAACDTWRGGRNIRGESSPRRYAAVVELDGLCFFPRSGLSF